MTRSVYLSLLLTTFSFWSQPVLSKTDIFPKIKQSIINEDLNQLEALLKNVNIQNESGHSPLYIATRQKKIKVVRWLLEKKKANINIQTRFGRTALHQAVSMNHLPLVELFLKHKAKINLQDNSKNTALHYATKKYYPKAKNRTVQINIIKNLIKNKADINIKNSISETALHTAAQNGNNRAVFLLLKNKPLVNAKNFYGQTALHVAIKAFSEQSNAKKQDSYKAIIKGLLSQKNINTSIADQNGRTPLHIAAEKGLLNLVKIIVEKDPSSINTQTKEGWTALHLASGNRHAKVVKFLISKGADVNLQAKDGSTAIHFAVGAGSKEVVAMLLKSKASLFFKDPKTNKDKLDSGTQKKLQSLLDKFYSQSKK